MSQPDWQSQAKSKTREAGQKIREFAQSEQVQRVTTKLKSRWLALSRRNKFIFVGIVALCLLSGVWLLSGRDNTITAGALHSAFKRDKAAASRKYRDRPLVVSGTVDDIRASQGHGQIAISLEVGEETFPICVFPLNKNNVSKLKPVKHGDLVTIEGTCKGMGGDGDRYVILEECVLKSRESGAATSEQARSEKYEAVADGSYVDAALRFREECGKPYTQGVPKEDPGSRMDMIHALQLLEFKLGHKLTEDGVYKMQLVGALTKEDWGRVFGQPDELPDGYDTFINAKFQRWRHECTDGPLTFHGSIGHQMNTTWVRLE